MNHFISQFDRRDVLLVDGDPNMHFICDQIPKKIALYG